MKVELVWATANGDDLVAKMARVSNPSNENNKETAPRLIRFLKRNKHWSPFEMVNACVYIECPRDVSRQILRHRSFSFQEFSGRYSDYVNLLDAREPRLRDETNRQNSIPLESSENELLAKKWEILVETVRSVCFWAYRSALNMGIAKEVARVLLPEGLVPTRMYVNGTLRSWIHYLEVRCDEATQKEHREVANAIRDILRLEFPQSMGA